MDTIKKFRKCNKISQVALAEYLGVTQGFISQMENGASAIPDSVIRTILVNPYNWDTSMLKGSDQPEDSMAEQPDPDTSLVEYLKRKVAELEGKVEKLTDEKADLLQQNAVLKYENQLLAPQKGRNAEDAESFLSASAAQ